MEEARETQQGCRPYNNSGIATCPHGYICCCNTCDRLVERTATYRGDIYIRRNKIYVSNGTITTNNISTTSSTTVNFNSEIRNARWTIAECDISYSIDDAYGTIEREPAEAILDVTIEDLPDENF